MKSTLPEYLAPVLKGKKILVGISGSIAAFKSIDLIRLLKECGAEVRVVVTKSALEFVTHTTLETLSENPVLSSLWECDQGTHHIDTARWADLIVCAPATANLISKLNWGIADDLLTTEILAFKGSVVIAPAMNPQMYHSQATQNNIESLKKRGSYFFSGPVSGVTACKEEGEGRMNEVDVIVEDIARQFYNKSISKKALVNFGPTLSFYDPVRFISNRSSGKMGVALTWALSAKGYDVVAIGNNVSHLPLPKTAEYIPVSTTGEMDVKMSEYFPLCDLLIASAAVLDFEFEQTHAQKIKKEGNDQHIHLKQTEDILLKLGSVKKSGQFILGFAAETDHIKENAESKKKRKNLDAVFVNDVSQKDIGFESSDNAGFWMGNESVELKKESKIQIAIKLLDLIEKQWQ